MTAASDDSERRDALRALLRHPLLTADGPHADELLLVRRHREHLQRWCAEALGYRLVVEPQAARLFKAGLGRDATRPLRKRNDRPFEPRAYALLCLVLAALTRCPAQLLIDELVAHVRSAVADTGLGIDLDTVSDRRALAAALGALLSYGVLVERDGDFSRWAEDGVTQSLLDVRRERLRLLLSTAVAGATGPQDLLDAAALPSAAGGARVTVRRRLLESPVLSHDDLTPDQLEWWRRSRSREAEWFSEYTGLELELRSEGALAIDPAETLTDTSFPGTGSARHAALLVLERLVARVRDDARGSGLAWCLLPAGAVATAVDEVQAEHGRGLRKAYADVTVLRADVVDVLSGSGLLRSGDQGDEHLHAAAARYAPQTSYAAGLF